MILILIFTNNSTAVIKLCMKLFRALRYCTIIAYQPEYSRKPRRAWIEIFGMPYSIGKWQQHSIVATLDSVH